MSDNINVEYVVVGESTPTAVSPVRTHEVGGAHYQEMVSGLVPKPYDYYAVTYVASGNGVGEVETITYKTGGSGGSTVATVTYTYDASNRVITATRT